MNKTEDLSMVMKLNDCPLPLINKVRFKLIINLKNDIIHYKTNRFDCNKIRNVNCGKIVVFLLELQLVVQ